MEENLEELIRLFYEDKQQLENYKKSTEEYNKQIKEGLTELGVNDFATTDGIIAKKIIQKRESFDEPNLIAKLLELNYTDIVELVPTINYDKLEDAIYNNKIDASILSDYKTTKEVVTLKVTKKKGE